MNTFDFDNVKVSCNRVCCNPCALDEYEVIIKQGEKITSVTTFASIFESDKDICKRVYNTIKKQAI